MNYSNLSNLNEIRQEFERNRYVNNLPVINVLLFKGQAEFQELNNFWKQQTYELQHIVAIGTHVLITSDTS